MISFTPVVHDHGGVKVLRGMVRRWKSVRLRTELMRARFGGARARVGFWDGCGARERADWVFERQARGPELRPRRVEDPEVEGRRGFTGDGKRA